MGSILLAMNYSGTNLQAQLSYFLTYTAKEY